MDKYILNEAGEPVLCEDLLTWAHWFQFSREKRILRRTTFEGGPFEEPPYLSTVFLALDHRWGDGPPLLYETMTFEYPPKNHDCRRYSTKALALQGHEEALARMRAYFASEGYELREVEQEVTKK